ncbi:MAG: HNH endonuclease [Marvinbryantia sp.]|jgi:hypothetical protein
MNEIGKNMEITSVERLSPEINGFREIKPEGDITFQESQKYWDEFFNSEIKENPFFSTYEERLKQTPGENSDLGKWDGDRGESKFIPNDSELKGILKKYGLDGILFENAIPDFSPVSESTVEIDNMTENRAENFRQCDEKCAKQWNQNEREEKTNWMARDVALWRRENGYSWHERNNMETCDLVPSKVNAGFGHLGGVSECRKRDTLNEGGDFDE